MKRHGFYIVILLIVVLAIMNSASAENSLGDLISDTQYENSVDINIADDNLKSYQNVSSDLEDINEVYNLI